MADTPKRTRRKAAADNGTPRTNTPTYVVVKVDGNRLDVVAPGVVAKNQDTAMEHVYSRMPEDAGAVQLGAFLATGWKTKKFDSRLRRETFTSDVEHTFSSAITEPTPQAAPE
jgi:hypothetical protein